MRWRRIRRLRLELPGIDLRELSWGLLGGRGLCYCRLLGLMLVVSFEL